MEQEVGGSNPPSCTNRSGTALRFGFSFHLKLRFRSRAAELAADVKHAVWFVDSPTLIDMRRSSACKHVRPDFADLVDARQRHRRLKLALDEVDCGTDAFLTVRA